jgi:hypothetical protein
MMRSGFVASCASTAAAAAGVLAALSRNAECEHLLWPTWQAFFSASTCDAAALQRALQSYVVCARHTPSADFARGIPADMFGSSAERAACTSSPTGEDHLAGDLPFVRALRLAQHVTAGTMLPHTDRSVLQGSPFAVTLALRSCEAARHWLATTAMDVKSSGDSVHLMARQLQHAMRTPWQDVSVTPGGTARPVSHPSGLPSEDCSPAGDAQQQLGSCGAAFQHILIQLAELENT